MSRLTDLLDAAELSPGNEEALSDHCKAVGYVLRRGDGALVITLFGCAAVMEVARERVEAGEALIDHLNRMTED